jgi:hypothetical protein
LEDTVWPLVASSDVAVMVASEVISD